MPDKPPRVYPDRDLPAHEDAELRMRELIAQAGLPEPDEVIHHAEDEELELIWHEQKLAVVIELSR